MGCRAKGEKFAHACFETVAQNPRRRAAIGSHQSPVEMLRGSHVSKKKCGVDAWRVAGGGLDKRRDDAFKLRAQQIVLGRVVGVERRPAYSGLLHDLADADVAVGTAVKQFDEGRVNSLSSAPYAFVFAVESVALRDVCRFLFRNWHASAVFNCEGECRFIASAA